MKRERDTGLDSIGKPVAFLSREDLDEFRIACLPRLEFRFGLVGYRGFIEVLRLFWGH